MSSRGLVRRAETANRRAGWYAVFTAPFIFLPCDADRRLALILPYIRGVVLIARLPACHSAGHAASLSYFAGDGGLKCSNAAFAPRAQRTLPARRGSIFGPRSRQ